MTLDAIKQTAAVGRNSFYRRIGDYGYIVDQHSRKDRLYDPAGRVFLEQFSRKPRTVADIIEGALSVFQDAPRERVESDFTAFVRELEEEGFIVTGNDPDDVERKQVRFSYDVKDGKTYPNTSIERQKQYTDTTTFFVEHFRDNPFIMSFQFETTSRCNERCRHCYLPHERDMRDMPASLVFSLLDQLREMGTIGVTFSGGECLLHPNMKDFLLKARENDFSISVLSNLTMLDDPLLDVLREVNLNLLQVSVYSMDPEEHDWITQLPGSHRKTMEAIERLVEADVPVQISCPTMRKNFRSYKGVLEWAYQRRIKAYTDHIMMGRVDGTTDNLDNRMDQEETELLIREMLETDIEYRAIISASDEFSLPEGFETKPVCGAGVDTMCVAANGQFFPCSGFQGYPLGNAYTQTVREVWESSPEVIRIRGVRWKDFPKCVDCDTKPFCSVCMVRNLNETGDLFTPSEVYCKTAFLNKRLVEEFKTKHPR